MSHDEHPHGPRVDVQQAEGDAIARLLRFAGPRPAVPDERATRVKAAVRSRWLRDVHARRARRQWIIGGLASAAALAVALGLALWSRPDAPARVANSAPVARLEAATGSMAQILEPGETRLASLGIGASVPQNSTVLTGADGRAALRLSNGASLRLDHGSRLRLVSPSELLLEIGAVYVDNGSSGGDRVSLQVHTAFGVARDLGTQFEVRLADSHLRLRVREGTVVLQRPGGVESAGVGAELTVDAQGGLLRHVVEVHGPEWDWVVGIAPAFEIEGANLEEFLSWASRETGWATQIRDPEVLRAAPDIVLHGSIDGLTPAEALDAVLPTCGLTHAVDGGTLRVERSGRRP